MDQRPLRVAAARRWAGWAAWFCLLGSSVLQLPAADLKSDEQIIFFPILARPAGTDWELEIHGWIYEPEDTPLLAGLLRRALGIDLDTLTAAERDLYAKRAQLFLVDNERGKTVQIRLSRRTERLNPSTPDGHFRDRLRLAREEATAFGDQPLSSGTVQIQVWTADRQVRRCPTYLQLLDETGLSVISDIDDTIKISQVQDRQALLRNTFTRPFEPVPGMAALYRRWAADNAAQFHYVSASPWQLYLPLSDFVHTNRFPYGSFHQKPFRMKDQSFFDLFRSPEKFKLDAIQPLLKQFPKRRFILVGDSGEKDPEIYATLARKHGPQIVGICIRDVTRQPPDSDRYRQAFKDLPPTLWRVFHDPSELDSVPPPSPP